MHANIACTQCMQGPVRESVRTAVRIFSAISSGPVYFEGTANDFTISLIKFLTREFALCLCAFLPAVLRRTSVKIQCLINFFTGNADYQMRAVLSGAGCTE